VSVTGACSLQESKNTESVWKMRKTGFCEGGHKCKNCLLTRQSITGERREDSYFVPSCLLLFYVLPM